VTQSPGTQDIHNTTLLKRSSEDAGLAGWPDPSQYYYGMVQVGGCKNYRELLTQYFN